MSTITIAGDILRIEYHDRKNFVDVSSPDGYMHYALEFSNIDNFNFYALIRWKDSRYSKESLICFPDKTWFNQWLKTVDVDIIYLSEHDNREKTK